MNRWALSVLVGALITIIGGAFGPTGDGQVRLSFGFTEAELGEAFDRSEQWLVQA